MSDPNASELAREARRAWWRAAMPSSSSTTLLVASVAVAAFTLVAVGTRLALLFSERSWAVFVVFGMAVALALALIAAPVWIFRRRLAAMRTAMRAPFARECPRCGAEDREQRAERSGARCRDQPGGLGGFPPQSDREQRAERSGARCACGARLLEAEGLLIVRISDPRWRARRFAARARDRASPPHAWQLAPALWMAAALGALALLWSTAFLIGSAIGLPPRLVEAPLALDEQLSMHGTAHAWTSDDDSASLTRRRAPLTVGTQVLARRGGTRYHELAVIVHVDSDRAFVIYADGGSAWARRRDVLVPELATGDAIEVRSDGRFVSAEIIERVGPAVRILRADGARVWTSDARLRVREDASHAPGEGIESDVPSGAWVEARVDGGWRPAIAVWRRMGRVEVALSDGRARWLDEEDVRAQRIGPGVRVRVDGRPRPPEVIVAARMGHALAVVDADGTRGWTALSRCVAP